MPSDEHPTVKDAYDELADEYATDIAANAYNEHIEFPGTSGLVPDVEGRRILDAGCGSGYYTEWLLDQGAEVVGVDVSDGMLEYARERVGDRATFHRADLAEPLSFAGDGSFDGVVSALALGYVADWRQPFGEFARILAPGGFVVCSVHHPFDEFPLGDDANYFDVERRTKEWSVDVPYYRRPLTEIVGPVLESGFRIDALAEPQPTETFREKRPDRYETESRRPVFLALRAVAE